MKAQELLSKYPLAGKVVKDWFLEKMIESMNTDSVPEDFKQAMLAEGISDDRLGTVIDAQPRALFDVFDQHEMSINIIRTPSSVEEWDWEIMQTSVENSICKSRKEAEVFAIQAAFKALEDKLTPNELPKLADLEEPTE
jgi:transcription initiation factor TFIIIB Brf1 subunit/transcription initiation factor TFIIB